MKCSAIQHKNVNREYVTTIQMFRIVLLGMDRSQEILHSSIASLTTVDCTPDYSTLRPCCRCSSTCLKTHSRRFSHPFVANTFINALALELYSYRFFLNKM